MTAMAVPALRAPSHPAADAPAPGSSSPGGAAQLLLRRYNDGDFHARFLVGRGLALGRAAGAAQLYAEAFPRIVSLASQEQRGFASTLDLPEGAEGYDFIIADGIVAGFEDPLLVLPRLASLLRPDGWLVLTEAAPDPRSTRLPSGPALLDLVRIAADQLHVERLQRVLLGPPGTAMGEALSEAVLCRLPQAETGPTLAGSSASHLDWALAEITRMVQQRRYAEGERACRELIERGARSAKAWNLLGAAIFRQGRAAEAVAALRQGVAAFPDAPDLPANVGVMLEAASDVAGARAAYEEAIRRNPRHEDALTNLGVLERQAGNGARAGELLARAIAVNPANARAQIALGMLLESAGDLQGALARLRSATLLERGNAGLHLQVGLLLHRQGRYREAIESYRQSLRLAPANAGAYINLGAALRAENRADDALAAYEEALRLEPNNIDALFNRGNLLHDQGKHEAGAVAYGRCVELAPENARARACLGASYIALGDYEKALVTLRGALDRDPNSPEAHINLGLALHDQGAFEEAERIMRRSLELRPDDATAHLNFSLRLLLSGRLREGWQHYERRLENPMLREQVGKVELPVWRGFDDPARSILLQAEQGLGDAIHFVRYAKLLKARGLEVTLSVPAILAPLMARQNLGPVHVQGEPAPRVDARLAMLSAPHRLGTELGNIPGEVPYIAPDPERVARWRAAAGTDDARPRVGLVWAGNPKHRKDRERSLPLRTLLPLLARFPGIRWISLQKDVPAADLEPFTGAGTIENWGQRLADFDDTAAAISCLDLLLTVDTSVAHLAGAMGAPTWMLLPSVPDWRWLLRRDDSPWYPSLRLFRQRERGSWADPIEATAAALEERFFANEGAKASARSKRKGMKQ